MNRDRDRDRLVSIISSHLKGASSSLLGISWDHKLFRYWWIAQTIRAHHSIIVKRDRRSEEEAQGVRGSRF